MVVGFMSSIKSIWSYVVLFMIVVFSVLVFAVFDSKKSNRMSPKNIESNAAIEKNNVVVSEEAVSNLGTNIVNDDFPIPAKKLHQLINEAEVDESLFPDEKIQRLDKQLAAINEQLKTKGVDFPEQQPQTAASLLEIEGRLKAIENHLQYKQKASN